MLCPSCSHRGEKDSRRGRYPRAPQRIRTRPEYMMPLILQQLLRLSPTQRANQFLEVGIKRHPSFLLESGLQIASALELLCRWYSQVQEVPGQVQKGQQRLEFRQIPDRCATGALPSPMKKAYRRLY